MTIIRFKSMTDADAFFRVVDSCRGKVELISSEGERLNIKSKLNQYVSLVKIFSEETVGRLEIVAAEASDMEKIMDFMMNR